VTLVTDYFIILSGASRPQVRAIVEHVEQRMADQGARMLRREGYTGGRWVLLDYGAVVVHVFHAEERAFYGLERLWGDARMVRLADGNPSALDAGGG